MDDSNKNVDTSNKAKRPSGILRVDIGKPRRLSGGSVEFRNQPEFLGQERQNSSSTLVSPQLSVTWAFPQDPQQTSQQRQLDPPDHIQLQKRDSENSGGGGGGGQQRCSITPNKIFDISPSTPCVNDSDEDDDYSLSVSAIMQRRASVRGSKRKSFRGSRRTSSPMGHIIGLGNLNERRRSSVFTTSSGETAISFDDGTNQDSTQEQIFENIRLHKEVLQSVKLQPWTMRRKLRLVRQAREYVARHEGALQERFAMSRSTKDLLTRFRILLAARLQHFRRELANLSTVLIPWERRIKEIESHFGSVVASYFTFLRWLFWVNIVIAVVLTAFVVTPELFAQELSSKDERNIMLEDEARIAPNLLTIWDFEGYLKYSPLFYGYYSPTAAEKKLHYNLPMAYFLTGLVAYVYSFVATLRKMAENSRMSKLSSKDDECVFTWKLFTGWDFMIGHAETAHNRVASVVLGFKEALLEEAEKKRDKRNWKVLTLRIFVNIFILCLLGVSAFAVVLVVNRSTEKDANISWWRRSEITIVIALISYFFPMFFEGLGYFESYHPRIQLRRQLARIMILNLLNLYSLIFALFGKIHGMSTDMREIRQNITNYNTLMASFKPELTTMETSTVITSSGWPMQIMAEPAVPTTISTIAEVTTFFINEITTHYYDYASSSSSSVPVNSCVQTQVSCNGPYDISKNFILPLSILKFLSARMLKKLNLNTKRPLLSIAAPTTPVTTEDYTNFFSTTEYPFYSSSNLYDIAEDMNATINFVDIDNSTAYDSDSNGTIAANYTRLKRQNSPDAYDEDDYSMLLPVVIDEAIAADNENNIYDYLSKLYLDYEASDPANDTTPVNSTEIQQNVTDLIDSTFTTFIDSFTTDYETTTEPYGDYFTNENDVDQQEEEESQMSKKISKENLKFFLEDIANRLAERNATSKVCYNVTCPDEDEETTTESYYESTPTVLEFMPTEKIFTTTMVPITSTIIISNSSSSFWNGTAKPINDTIQIVRPTRNYTAFIEGRLRKLCWETMFGQELVKLTVMDLLMTILSILVLDFIRALFVRFMNKFWCWDLEKTFPKYGDFKIAENILHLVNNQGMVWMGMFFSPGLAILNLVKLVIILYLRSWAVLTCNVPHEVVFRASRSNNFYLALLLTMLFLCVLPVAFAIVWLEPSWHCGPFAMKSRIYLFFTDTVEQTLPETLKTALQYVASPSTVIPLLVLLVLIIYYLISLTNALREANQDLKTQLRRERTEERRKMFKIAENPNNDSQNAPNTLSARWKKVLENNSPLTPTGANLPEIDETKAQARKELLARIMKKALRKSSGTSDDDSHLMHADDATDTEQHESLPHDKDYRQERMRQKKGRSAQGNDSKLIDQNKSKQVTSWLALVRSAGQKEKPSKETDQAHDFPAPPEYTVSHSDIPQKNRKNNINFQNSINYEAENRANNEKTASKPTAGSEFAVVNEKLVKNANTEPEVFKFDEVLLALKKERDLKKQQEQEKQLKEEDDEYMSDDMSSYREINLTTIEKSAQQPNSSESNAIDSNTAEVDGEHTLKKHKDENKSTRRKKLNSFLNLVREAVQNKKAEGDINSPDGASASESPKSGTKPFNLSRHNDSYKDKEKSYKKHLKKSSTSSAGTLERKPSRQDSLSSIQPDIPVITISKTGSVENILSADNKPAAAKQSKSKPNDSQKPDKKSVGGNKRRVS